MTKLEFFSMIHRLRDNPCMGRAPNPIGIRKRAWTSRNLKQRWMIFLYPVVYLDWLGAWKSDSQSDLI